MGRVNNHTDGQDNSGDKNQLLEYSCTSPLHAIPGFDRVTHRKLYPKDSILFAEGHAARGVYVLCSGRAKLSLISAEGRALIVRIARPGDLLVVHATLAEHSYEATAETLAPCHVDFISRKTSWLFWIDKRPSASPWPSR